MRLEGTARRDALVALTKALVLAAVWLSPAALFGVGALLTGDGTRGLWLPLVLGAAALLGVVVLAEPWTRLGGRPPASLLALARRRWPAAGPVGPILLLPVAGSAVLFLWAQLAAGRELARALGLAAPIVLFGLVAVAVVAGWRSDTGWVAAAMLSGAGVLGAGTGLVAVMVATTPAWPRVWAEVVSRPRLVVSRNGPWAGEGWPLRGLGPEITLLAREPQTVVLLGRGRVRVQRWDGGEATRDVHADGEMALRPGDRLVVPDGFRVRLEPGRPIPGAPATGPDWVDPSGPRADWRTLAGLAATLLLGGLGMAPVHAALPAGRAGGRRAVFLAPALVVVGGLAFALWTLYALWLTPEIYIGGVAALELLELPAAVSALGALGPPLAALALGAVASLGLAATLAAFLAVPGELGLPPGSAPVRPGAALPAAVLAVAAALAVAAPADPWRVLVAAFGFSASTGAPVALFGCWRERASPRGLGLGSAVGAVAFGVLAVAGLGTAPRAEEVSWAAWVVAWPAVVAAPANALVAWLLSPQAVVSVRGTLPPDLAALHDDT